MIGIRKAVWQDAEEILEFCKLAGGETENLTYGAEGIGVSVEEEETFLKSMEDSDNKLFLVAVEEGQVVGICSYIGCDRPRLKHRGEVSMAVRKSMWGKDIGTRFMERVLAFARQAGGEIVSLEVRSDNIRAIRLYEKFGFEKVGSFEGYMKINRAYANCDMMRLDLRNL